MSKKKNRMTKNRMVDLSGLPRYYKGIDWKNTIGYKISFRYDNHIGVFNKVKSESPELAFGDFFILPYNK